MKILRLSAFLDYGGIESKMVNLSTYQDVENTWIFGALGKGGVAETEITANSKQVFCLNMPHRIPSISTIITLYKVINSIKPDVIHCSGAEANFHGFISAKLARVPKIVLEEIGMPSQSKLAKFIFKVIYKFADVIVGESKVVTDHLGVSYNIGVQKLKTVPNFCIFKDSVALTKREEHKVFTIISVSRLEAVKNLEAIIRVVHKLKLNFYRVGYQIIGDGSAMIELKNLVEGLGLQNEVTFVGFVKDPTHYLLKANLFILNSFSEGFSNSLLEAMYLKVPSITTDVGAAQEIIKEGYNGWIVGVDNELELYEKVQMVVNLDEVARNNIGQQGSEDIMKNYSLQAHVERLMDIYKN
jgi:glycosyltransferase involved in cell wall biosynthesis